MGQHDILFQTEDGVFSYRVAGIWIRDDKVLLQRPINDPGYAFPGGHVAFGETSESALIREFREEIGVDIRPVRLLWIGEIFFPWDEKDCHQICLYYLVAAGDETQLPTDRSFWAQDELGGKRCDLEFSWIDLAALINIEVYPMHTREKLIHLSDHIERFVFVEDL